jgi:hypothetical protein
MRLRVRTTVYMSTSANTAYLIIGNTDSSVRTTEDYNTNGIHDRSHNYYSKQRKQTMKSSWAISHVSVKLVSDVSATSFTLMWLIARETFSVHCRCETFKSTKIKPTNFQCELLNLKKKTKMKDQTL